MTKLTKEELLSVADRGFLFISDEEAELYTAQLSDKISHHLSKMNEVDTEGIIPMTHVAQPVNVMREDIVADVLDRETMLEGIIEHKSGGIKVPAIL